jgi:hypothetical protein
MTPSGRDNPSLAIKRVVGAHGGIGHEITLTRDFVPSECMKVEYTPNFPQVDFFRSLGALSHEKLYRFWYKGDADGDYSVCATEAFKDQAARDEYWKAFEAGALCKTPDWKHEEEYRILLHSGFPLQELALEYADSNDAVQAYRTEGVHLF